jgi:hypothetical protein
MAPLDQYLMADRNAEIALAKSAAPDSVSRDAEVVVLGRHGYETAVKGKNGFVCIVERSWVTPVPDDPEFWNPKQRFPICYNPPAARSALPLTFKKTELELAGALSQAQLAGRIKTAYAKKELPSAEPGGMAYMMSKDAYLTDVGAHNQSHVMFFLPHMGERNWGANLPNMPVHMRGGDHDSSLDQSDGGSRIDVVGVFVPVWSDGTPATVGLAASR